GERGSRPAALEEERVPLRVVGEQEHRALPAPVDERHSLVLALAVRVLELEHRLAPVREGRRDRERVRRAGKGIAEPELPALAALGDERRQPRQPGATGLAPPDPGEPCRRGAHGLTHDGCLARDSRDANYVTVWYAPMSMRRVGTGVPA